MIIHKIQAIQLKPPGVQSGKMIMVVVAGLAKAHLRNSFIMWRILIPRWIVQSVFSYKRAITAGCSKWI
jgi:hypothetical protein